MLVSGRILYTSYIYIYIYIDIQLIYIYIYIYIYDSSSNFLMKYLELRRRETKKQRRFQRGFGFSTEAGGEPASGGSLSFFCHRYCMYSGCLIDISIDIYNKKDESIDMFWM